MITKLNNLKKHVHAKRFSKRSFITDLNAVLNTDLSKIDISIALMILETLDAVLLDKHCAKEINDLDFQRKIPEFYSKLKYSIENARTQIVQNLFLAIPEEELNTLSSTDKHYRAALADFNNFSEFLVLYTLSGYSYAKAEHSPTVREHSYAQAVLKRSHLIDMLGIALEKRNFHDVWAIYAALNNTAIQQLFKNTPLSEQQQVILDRMAVLGDERNEYLNLRHAMYADAIPALSIYASYTAKNELISQGSESGSLFKPAIISMRDENKRRATTAQATTSFPPAHYNQLQELKKIISEMGKLEHIITYIETDGIFSRQRDDFIDALQDIATDKTINSINKNEQELAALTDEYQRELSALRKNHNLDQTVDVLAQEEGFAEYEQAYSQIIGEHNLAFLGLEFKNRQGIVPDYAQELKKIEGEKQIKIADLNLRTQSGQGEGHRFESIAKIRSLQNKIRECKHNLTSSRDNLGVTINNCLFTLSIFSTDRPLLKTTKKIVRRKTSQEFMDRMCPQPDELVNLPQALKLVGSRATSKKAELYTEYEKIIDALRQLIRIDYAALPSEGIFKGIEPIVAAVGLTGKDKLGTRAEIEQLLTDLIWGDDEAYEGALKKLGFNFTLDAELTLELCGLRELFIAQTATQNFLRDLEFKFTHQDKLQYLCTLQMKNREELQLPTEVWEAIDKLKESLRCTKIVDTQSQLAYTKSYYFLGKDEGDNTSKPQPNKVHMTNLEELGRGLNLA